MSNIGGKKKEQGQGQGTEYPKKVGLFEANVIAINPTEEEYNDILGMELKEGSKAVEYLSTSKEGNTTLRVDVWLEEVKTKTKFKSTFFLENKEKVNKDGTKKQYINNVGSCSWASDANDLPTWFANRDYRVAFVGEEELYTFLKIWLGNLDYRDADTTLQLEWKSVMKGNLKDLKYQLDGDYCTTVGGIATIRSVEKDGETKEYQGIYNKGFFGAYNLKYFRLMDYSSPSVLNTLRGKKSKDLKPHERFVLNVTGEYGCKDFYILKDMKDYSADDNLVASNAVISDDGGDY